MYEEEQSFIASAPRHRNLQESHGNHELFCDVIFERILAEASRLAYYNRRSTASSRKIQTAVRLSIPGELSKQVVSEGTEYTSSK